MFDNSERGVLIKCKKCGQEAFSKEFILDPDYGMVVCPHCIKMKSGTNVTTGIKNEPDSLPDEETKQVEEEIKDVPEAQPVDYDSEDKYLEKAAAEKEQSQINVDFAGKTTCRKCNYKFKYNAEKDIPRMCPYCATRVGEQF